MQMNSKMMSKKVQLFISGRLLDLNCFQTIIYTAFQDVLALLHTKITIASSRGIRYIQIFRENVSMCSLFTQSSAIVFFKKFLFNTHLLSFHLYISPLTASSLTRNHFFLTEMKILMSPRKSHNVIVVILWQEKLKSVFKAQIKKDHLLWFSRNIFPKQHIVILLQHFAQSLHLQIKLFKTRNLYQQEITNYQEKKLIRNFWSTRQHSITLAPKQLDSD